MPDLQKIFSGADVNYGRTICSALKGGEYSASPSGRHLESYAIYNNIVTAMSGKLDTRFDDPTYYTA